MSTAIQHIISSRPSPRTKEQGFVNPIVPRRSDSQARTEQQADYLVDKFGAPEYRPAFLKLAWNLEPSFIAQAAEQAMSRAKSSARGYFIASCKNEMRRRGLV